MMKGRGTDIMLHSALAIADLACVADLNIEIQQSLIQEHSNHDNVPILLSDALVAFFLKS